MTRHVVSCRNVYKHHSLHVKNKQGFSVIHYKGGNINDRYDHPLPKRINPITTKPTTESHVCKQKQAPTTKCLSISNTLVDMYLNFFKYLALIT